MITKYDKCLGYNAMLCDDPHTTTPTARIRRLCARRLNTVNSLSRLGAIYDGLATLWIGGPASGLTMKEAIFTRSCARQSINER